MNKFYLNLVIFFSVFTVSKNHSQTITTIAGTGTGGYNGDNIAATIAQINKPTGMVVDNVGNVIITDFINNRIRKVNTSGFISTIAGNGNSGYNGDNIAGTVASLFSPQGPALDKLGNLYFSDGNNNRIRKLGTDGFITTVAGTGTYGYNNDNIPATSAQLNYPSDGVAVDDAGNIYIADTYNNRIRKVNTSGIITTVAGTGVAGYNNDNIPATSALINNPLGIALDLAGNLYIADASNHRIRKVSTTGIITTVAGNGIAGFSDNALATNSKLNNPIAVVVDGGGNIFIADTYNNRIRKVNTSGVISTICGTGTTTYNGDNIQASLANISFPNGLALDNSGNLYVADLANHRIRKINSTVVILPLTLTKFTAQLQGGSGLLQWQTMNEVNTQKFIVERSQNGVNFSSLDSLKAKNATGKNDYTYTDASVKDRFTYYRLKIVDRDGKFSYSNVATIKILEIISLSMSPNPIKNIATFNFVSSLSGKCLIQITDINGRTISQYNTIAVVGNNKMEINSYSFAKGNYILTITNTEGEKVNIKFTK